MESKATMFIQKTVLSIAGDPPLPSGAPAVSSPQCTRFRSPASPTCLQKILKSMEYTRICPICGRSFVTHHVQIMYCGEECRVTARRKKDREAKAKTRAKLSEDRKRKQEQFEQSRMEDMKDRAQRSRDAFEARCASGDPRALIIRAKAHGGTLSETYWHYFALIEIADAERDGKTARTFVNGISVYEDDFASKVIEDIKLRGHIYIELRR